MFVGLSTDLYQCEHQGRGGTYAQRQEWRGFRVLCYRSSNCETIYDRAGFGSITSRWRLVLQRHSDGGFAWRWSFRCGTVCIFRFNIDAG